MLQVFDGFTNLKGGMNGGELSSTLPDTQFSKGINITCRGGKISTRPAVVEITLQSDITGAVSRITTGKFQGSYFYKPGNTGYIAFAVSGSVYLMNPETQAIYDMTTSPGAFNEYADRLHFCQVERYLIVQDGSSTALVISGTSSRKAVAGEVPIGSVMAYGHGRLFVKTGEREFKAGKIVKAIDITSVLKFTETDYFAGGGAFSTPADFGPITGMRFTHHYGTGTGNGPLVVFCEYGKCSYDVSVSRTTWQDVPIASIEPGDGATNDASIVAFNEDLLFCSWNGLQDFALLSTEAAKTHRMTSLVKEIDPFFAQETKSHMQFISACRFDNRYLFTIIGEQVTALDTNGEATFDYRFKGLASLDYSVMDGITSLGETLKPAYDGLWTGFNPMGIISGIFDHDERCFIFGKDNDGTNHLYELTKTPAADNGVVPINCRLYTRAMPFVAYDQQYPRQVPFMHKTVLSANIWLSNILGEVEFKLYMRPEMSGAFGLVSTLNVSAPATTGAHSQTRAKARFPHFNEDVATTDQGSLVNRGFEVECCIEWDGVAEISRLGLEAAASDDIPRFDCLEQINALTDVERSDYDYDIVTLEEGETEEDSTGGTPPDEGPPDTDLVVTYSGDIEVSATPIFVSPVDLPILIEDTTSWTAYDGEGDCYHMMLRYFEGTGWELWVGTDTAALILRARSATDSALGTYNVFYVNPDSSYAVTVTQFVISEA